MSTHDPEFYQTPKYSPEKDEPPPRQRGCFFYGCIIASVLALLMVISVGILIFVGYRCSIRRLRSTRPPYLRNFPWSKCRPQSARR